MNQDLRRKMSRITNTLWDGGITNPVTHIEQISYLIYLKLLDEEEMSREQLARLKGRNGNSVSLFPQQASRFRWQKWRLKSGLELRDFLRDEVFPYMASLVREEPQVAEHFRDATLEIVDPNVLEQVVNEIDSIEFHAISPDVKGDIFEHLLTHLGQSALNGQFRTPKQIRAFMVAMTDPDIGDTVYDPACGTGGFLIDCVDHVLAKYSEEPHEVPIYGEEWLDRRGFASVDEARKQLSNLQTYRKGPGEKIPDWNLFERSIHGIDVSRQMMRISMMNLVLHGIRKANLKRGNVLSALGGLTEDDLKRRYEVILSNPQFSGVLPKESIRFDLPIHSRKSELLFLGVMMNALAPGGRCAVVVPEGLLFGSTRTHMELRKMLIETFDLLAVVSLPAGVFKPYSAIKTSVLVFRRPPEGSKSTVKKVWFYEIANDGYDSERVVGGERVETPEWNDVPDLLGQWNDYRQSGFKRPPGPVASALIDTGTDPPKCWWADVKLLVANDFNLAAGRYKPQVTEAVPEEDPADLIREVLDIEKEITKGLETLLVEVEGRQ